MQNIPEGLKRHAPLWYERLVNTPFEDVHQINIDHTHDRSRILLLSEYPYCIVGEKHGWSGKYVQHIWNRGSCYRCSVIAEYLNRAEDEEKFIDLLNRFVDHCDSKH